jgi:hypothetical protein
MRLHSNGAFVGLTSRRQHTAIRKCGLDVFPSKSMKSSRSVTFTAVKAGNAKMFPLGNKACFKPAYPTTQDGGDVSDLAGRTRLPT